MWGFGGRYYWEREERVERRKWGGREGIVVVFAWMSSQEKHLKNYVQLYSSLGWDSLVCHSELLNMYGFLANFGFDLLLFNLCLWLYSMFFGWMMLLTYFSI